MATEQSRRVRRFSLPDMGDERVDEAITAFLSGPKHRRGRPEAAASASESANPLATIQPRVAWMEALARESARGVRYRRPAAIVVIEGRPADGTPEAGRWVARVVGPIAHAVHRGLRETDLVTRAADARFQVLLPETTTREAAHVAERIRADCEVWLQAVGAPVVVRVASAATNHDTTLEMALEKALGILAAR